MPRDPSQTRRAHSSKRCMVTHVTGDNSIRSRMVSAANASSPVCRRILDCHCAWIWSTSTLLPNPLDRHYLGPVRKATVRRCRAPRSTRSGAHCIRSESENALGVGLIQLAAVLGADFQAVRHGNLFRNEL